MRRLDPEVLETVCAAIASRTSRITAYDGEHRHEVLERRRVEIGGMLELARRLAELVERARQARGVPSAE